MCKCIKESEARVLEFIKEEFKKKGIQVKEWTEHYTNGYTNVGLSLSSDSQNRMFSVFQMGYIPVLRDGSPGRKKTAKKNVYYSFCPFCGEKYPDEKEMKPVEDDAQSKESV